MKKLEPTWKLSEKQVLECFDFLQLEFKFPKFSKKWIKDEYYITTKKNNIEFTVLILQYSTSPPKIGITNHFEPIEFKTKQTPTNYYSIEKLDTNNELKKMSENGLENIKSYLAKCAKLLKENSNLLT